MRFWMALFNLGSSCEVGSLLRRSSRLFITSSISAGTGSSWSLWRPVGVWCDAALSRTVRKIFSSLWQSVGRERLLRAALKSAVRYSIALSQRCFRWKMMSLSGPKARMLLKLLIPLVTWSVVNVTAEVNDFRLIGLESRY